MKQNMKSDVNAKLAYKELLEKDGFTQVQIKAAPADIQAVKDGETWYFEIKKTLQKEKYFGAATLTEWVQAFKDPDHFRFVVAVGNEDESSFRFLTYTPAEFMAFSTIPPFKIFFNLDLTGKPAKPRSKKSKSVGLTEENCHLLEQVFKQMKK